MLAAANRAASYTLGSPVGAVPSKGTRGGDAQFWGGGGGGILQVPAHCLTLDDVLVGYRSWWSLLSLLTSHSTSGAVFKHFKRKTSSLYRTMEILWI